MQPTRKLIALALLALAAPLTASESIKLKSGKVVKGSATAYDAEKQVLHFRLEDGQEASYTLDQLDARSVYLVHTSVIPRDSARGQLQLANFARDAGLFEHAARRYGYAEQADPALEPEIDAERAKGRRMAAEFCLQNAEAARARNDGKETEKWLRLMLERLPNEPQAEQAASLLEASYTRTRTEREAAAHSAFTERVQKDIAKGKASYQSMVEKTQKGLTARNVSQSEKLWKGAIQDGEKVLDEIERLTRKYADEPRIQEGALQYRALTTQQMVEANLHLASQALIQSSFKSAQKHCNAALALDPSNAEALATRARIEQAANEGLFSWW